VSGIDALKGRSRTEVVGNRSKASRNKNVHGKKTDRTHSDGSIQYMYSRIFSYMEWAE
jgi:hypothetical protein